MLAKKLLLSLLLLLSVFAQAQFDAAPSLQGSGFGSDDDFLPVEEAYQLRPSVEAQSLQLDWTIAPGYYLYKNRFKAEALVDGVRVPLTLNLPDGEAKDDEYFGRVEVYYTELITQLGLPASDAAEVELMIRSQGCADAGLCYPPHDQRYLLNTASGALQALPTLPPGGRRDVTSNPAKTDPVFESELDSLWLALVYAFLGGLVLNLMPCVFPVLALKVFSVVEAHGATAAERRTQALVYSAGIVASFLLIATVLLSLRASGQALGWGFQLQSPWLVALLAYLFFVLGLALSGLIELGAGLAGAGQQLTQKKGLSGTFFTGVLAVVVASPCTAPLMGVALGYALVQPTGQALAVFAALGVGMAAPFALLTAMPSLTRHLPKPGPWMQSLKEFLAFPLYLSAVALLWLLGQQAGNDAVAMVLLGAVVIAMALWLWGDSVWRKALCLVLVLAALLIPFGGQLSPKAKVADKPGLAFSDARVAQLRAQGKPVFVNFTADWCVTCLANERVALSSQEFLGAMQQRDIAYLVADWTNSDPVISAVLSSYRRSGVPLYLLFPAQSDVPPIVLPQLLTPGILIEAIERLPEP